MFRVRSFLRAFLCGGFVLLAIAGTARAEVEFAHTSVDVGEVRCGAPLAHRFLFINRGTVAVEIEDVKTTCGCLAPQIARKVLQPGQEGSVLLEVNTLSQAAGPQDWWVKVYYRADGRLQEKALHIIGKVIEEISVEPATMTIYASQAVQHVLTLTDSRAKPLTITGVSATSPSLEARVGVSARTDKGQWAIPIQLLFTGKVADGRHQETLVICTSDPAYPELRVPVTLVKETQSLVTVAPSFVNLQGQEDRPLPSRILIIRNSGTEPVDVARISADNPAIHCSWAAGPESNATVKLTIDRSLIKGDHLIGTVRIEIRKPTTETLTVPVECLLE